MKIACAADHRGLSLKNYLIWHNPQIQWIDGGTYSIERTDFPLYVPLVARAVVEQEVDYGLLICGSGIGMSIAANRYQGIFAALVWDTTIALSARRDDDANILVLPADYVTYIQAADILQAFLQGVFAGVVYSKRKELVESVSSKKKRAQD